MTAKTFDDVVQAVAAGHNLVALVLDGVGYAVDTLRGALEAVTTNEPISRARGDTDQADLELKAQKEISQALGVLAAQALDDVGTPDVAAMMARLKLTGELSRLKKQIDALGAAAVDMLAKLKLVAQANVVRKQLGAGVPVLPPKPAPSDVTPESPHVGTLRAITAGNHDGQGLPELFGMIQEAVNALDEAGQLSGDVEELANDAITHWAELEEASNVGA